MKRRSERGRGSARVEGNTREEARGEERRKDLGGGGSRKRDAFAKCAYIYT